MTDRQTINRSEVHVYAAEDLRGGVPGALRFNAFYHDVVHVGRFDHTDDEAVGKWIVAFAEVCGANPLAMGWMWHKVEQAANEALAERRRIDRFDNRISAAEMRLNDQEREIEALKERLADMQAKLEQGQKETRERFAQQTKFLSRMQEVVK